MPVGRPGFACVAATVWLLGTAMLPFTHPPALPAPAPAWAPRQAMEFAQSKGNARREGSTGVTFADVGGLGGTIAEMMQVVEVRLA